MSRNDFRYILLGVVVLLVSGKSSHLDAQSSGMSISVYTDTTQTENLMLDVYATVIDNSWGCTHSSYMTTAYIYSPSGRLESNQTVGMYGSVDIAIDDEFGDYSVHTSGTYTCSCIYGGTAGYGGAPQTVTPRQPSDLVGVPEDQYSYTSPGNYLRTRTWQVKDQNTNPWNYIGTVTENYDPTPNENGCNLTVVVDSTFTNSQGRFQDRYGNYDNRSNPIPACAPPYNLQCTSKFTQTIRVAGVPFSHEVIYGCSDVSISRQ